MPIISIAMKSLMFRSFSIPIFLFIFSCSNVCISQCTNVALGKPATASNTWNSSHPAGLAFNGDCGSDWNAGAYATQWIQVDLQGTYTINNINLIVARFPNGNCTDIIYTAPNISGPWTQVDIITGNSVTGQRFERCYSSAPLTNVGAVKVATTSSPSWIAWYEIGVFTLSPPPTPTITASGPLIFCAGGSVVLTASPGSSYLWSNGSNSQSITVTTSGNYCVTVGGPCISGSTPCTSCGGSTICAQVTVNAITTVTVSQPNICNQQFSGSASANVTGCNPPYKYLWNNGSTRQTISGLASGIYTVTVTDAASAKTVATTTITLHAPLGVNITSSTLTCLGDNNGISTANISGGLSPYFYLWNTGKSKFQISNLPVGNYSVTITDVNGCTTSGSTGITFISSFTGSATGGGTIIQGDSVLLSASAAAGFLWNPSTGLSCATCANSMASPQQTTIYCVTMTDNLGCSDSACVAVNTEMNCNTEFFIPNSFSPNGDGINDTLFVYGNCMTGVSFKIFDRWGNQLFKSNDVTKGWDGSSVPDKTNYFTSLISGPRIEYESALFVYRFDAVLKNGEPITKRGYFTLVR